MIRALLLSSVLIAAIGAAPAPVPTPAALPEIGRITATSPACSAMRDLTIPSYAALLRINAHFAAAGDHLAEYAGALADYKRPQAGAKDVGFGDNPIATMRFNRLGNEISVMLRELQVVGKALGDPRLASESPDPALQAERLELSRMYVAQSARAKVLWEFYMRTNVTDAKTEFAGNAFPGLALETDGPNEAPQQDLTRRGIPDVSKYVGFIARREMHAWADDLKSAVDGSMNRGALVLLPIARNCGAANPAPAASP